MYDVLIARVLLPNLLKNIPQMLTHQIRNFAKSIHEWMSTALIGYDGDALPLIGSCGLTMLSKLFADNFIRAKVSAVNALSHMLRRYTSLNHLATAAFAVLTSPTQIAQMVEDLNKVDFKNVQASTFFSSFTEFESPFFFRSKRHGSVIAVKNEYNNWKIVSR